MNVLRFAQSVSSVTTPTSVSRRIGHQRMVVAGDQRAAAGRDGERGAHPVEDRHPVPAGDRNADPAHVPDQFAAGFDLGLGVRTAELRVLRPGKGSFEHNQIDTGLAKALFLPEQACEIGRWIAVVIARHRTDREVDAKLLAQIPGGGRIGGQHFRQLEEHQLLLHICQSLVNRRGIVAPSTLFSVMARRFVHMCRFRRYNGGIVCRQGFAHEELAGVIDLSSDTATRPSVGMRKAMAEAEVGDEQSRTDPTVNALQELVAELTGKEAAIFLPSGTMCNLIALTAHVAPGDGVIMEKSSHVNISEGGGAARFAGAMVRAIAGERGVFTGDQVRAEITAEGTHMIGTTLICVENTSNKGGGKVWPIERLAEIKAIGDEYGIPVHMDGARLMNAVVASGYSTQEIASHVDTVWIDLSKGLGAPVGAVLAGPSEFIEKSRLLKHRYGGAMRQAGIIAAAGLYAFEHNVERMAEDHANARLLEAGISQIPGITMVSGPVETNMLYFDVSGTGMTSGEVADRMAERGVKIMSPYRYGPVIRAVTHLDVTSEQCEQAVDILREVVSAA